MSTFAELASKRTGRSMGCPRCGADKNAGSVSVQASELGAKGSLVGGRRLTSRSVSLCESCAVEVYTRVYDLLIAESKASA